MCVCISECPVVLDPWFEVPAVGFAAAVAADEFAALALHSYSELCQLHALDVVRGLLEGS